MSNIIKKKIIIKPGTIVCDDFNMDKNFKKDELSPFKDGYDFFAQRNIVGIDLAAKKQLSLTDPFYPIWHDYKVHEKALETHILNMPKKGRGRPISSVDFDKIDIFPSEESIFQQIGKLHNMESDVIYIHTPHALRMWYGQIRRSMKDRTGFTGILLSIRYMRQIMGRSKVDNPYADWALVAIEQRIQKTKLQLTQKQEAIDRIFDDKRKIGITMSKMTVEDPMPIELDFNHPYGHLLVDLLAQFDHFVRSVQCLKIKATITATEAEKLIGYASNRMRSITEMINAEWRKLDMIQQISRKMLIVPPTETITDIFELLVNTLGPMPSDILLFRKAPDYFSVPPLYSEQNIKAIEQNALALGLITEDHKEYVDNEVEEE